MVFRSLPARLCKHCKRTEAWQVRARQASSSTAVFPDFMPATAAAAPVETPPVASTSQAATRILSYQARQARVALAKLEYEVHKAEPSRSVIWQQLLSLHQTAPAELSSELLKKSIPYLLDGGAPLEHGSGHQRLEHAADAAETLYARYAFLLECARQRQWPVSHESLFTRVFEALHRIHYAPVAWRLWQSLQKSNIIIPTRLSHLVLITYIRWLRLRYDNGLDKSGYAHATKQVRVSASLI